MLTTVVLAGDADERLDRCVRECASAGATSILLVTHSESDLVGLVADVRAQVRHVQVDWKDSFAYLRNAAIDHVGDGWVLFVDADEWPRSSLSELDLDSLDRASVYAPRIIEEGPAYVMSGVPRLVHSLSPNRFVGRVHEYCRAGPYADSPDLSPVPISFDLGHDGYALEGDNLERKARRNVCLARKDLTERPGDPRTTYFLLRDGLPFLGVDEAVALLQEAIAVSESTYSANGESARWYLARSHPLVVDLALRDNRPDVCTELIDRMLAGLNPEDGEYYRGAVEMMRGTANEGDLRRAIIYRQQNATCSSASLSEDGRHLDAAIVGLLLVVRGVGQAQRYQCAVAPWTDGFFKDSWPRLA